jgi:transcriptional regulator with XRE-family HTH domain
MNTSDTKFDHFKIREYREENHWSQEDFLIELANVDLRLSRNTLSSWEKGETSPSAEDLPKIAKALNKTVDDFFYIKT